MFCDSCTTASYQVSQLQGIILNVESLSLKWHTNQLQFPITDLWERQVYKAGKDFAFEVKFHVAASHASEVQRLISSDCDWLAEHDLMDHSLVALRMLMGHTASSLCRCATMCLSALLCLAVWLAAFHSRSHTV